MRQHPFDLLMELDSDLIRLDCAALHIARDYSPYINLPHYLAQLDELAAQVAGERPGLSAPLRYEALRRVLVEQAGFTGVAEADYYEPHNSLLNRVLDQRAGIPISLAVVWIEVGRRLKWPVSGVGFPGHFLIRIDDPERFVVADPFHDGRTLSLDDCRRMLKHDLGNRVPFKRELLDAVDTRAILVRMLNNLRAICLYRNDLASATRVLQRLAAIEPENGLHLQDLAAVHCRRGDLRRAYAHLELYLHRQPNAHDSALVRGSLDRLRAAVLAMN
jgi:regulator of sirC expression with transglutaminase-like and TPR domain